MFIVIAVVADVEEAFVVGRRFVKLLMPSVTSKWIWIVLFAALDVSKTGEFLKLMTPVALSNSTPPNLSVLILIEYKTGLFSSSVAWRPVMYFVPSTTETVFAIPLGALFSL